MPKQIPAPELNAIVTAVSRHPGGVGVEGIRSSQRYAAVRQSLGDPDPFRLKYRRMCEAPSGQGMLLV